MMTHPRKILASLGMMIVVVLLLYLCFRQVDFRTFWSELFRIKLSYLFLAFFILLAILWIKAVQWRLFLPANMQVSLKSMFEVIAVMIMMANTLPWGQVFAIYHLGHLHKTGKTVAMSVMTLDQITTGFSKLALVLLAALLLPLPVWMKRGTILTVVTVVGAYLILLYLSHRHREFQETTSPATQNRWKNLTRHFSKWAHHLHTLRDYQKTSLVIFLALIVKLCEAGGVYFVQMGFGLNLPWWSVIFVVAGLNLATSVPITPGNLGVFEATAFFIYKFLGIEPSQAMTLALFQHLIYLIPMVLPGYWIAMKMGIKIINPASLKTEPVSF